MPAQRRGRPLRPCQQLEPEKVKYRTAPSDSSNSACKGSHAARLGKSNHDMVRAQLRESGSRAHRPAARCGAAAAMRARHRHARILRAKRSMRNEKAESMKKSKKRAKSTVRDERRVARCGQGRWWWDERRDTSVGEVGEVQTLKNTIACSSSSGGGGGGGGVGSVWCRCRCPPFPPRRESNLGHVGQNPSCISAELSDRLLLGSYEQGGTYWCSSRWCSSR